MGHEASRVRCQYYLREGFVEDIKVKDGQLVPGLQDGERSEYARLSLAAGSVEVSGPLVSKVEDATAEEPGPTSCLTAPSPQSGIRTRGFWWRFPR